MWQFDDEPMGVHWSKRVAAYVVDSVIVLLLSLLIYMIFTTVDVNVFLDMNFMVIFGILSVIYFVAFEASIGTTVGKGILGMRIYTTSQSKEEPSLFDIFGRNITKSNPIILLVDLILKGTIYGDQRQKLFDILSDTIVVSTSYAYKEMPRPQVVAPVVVEEKKDVETVFLKEGAIYVKHCPKCGTPYRLIVRGGELEMLGPWQNRCTWCNTYITPDVTPDLRPLNEYTF